VTLLSLASPNFGPRRGDAVPDLAVIHYTGMTSVEAALARLRDPAAEVSAHYLITRSGQVVQLVAEAMRAWHAGAGAWGGVSDVNSRSIGVELDNDGRTAFPEAQLSALEALLAGLMARWRIPPARVIGHACMAPGRKADPGPLFPWARLARAGLAVWPMPRDRGAGDFETLARRAGYPVHCAGAQAVLAAFRARFRPDAAGPVTEDDLRLVADLAHRFPVDGSGAGA